MMTKRPNIVHFLDIETTHLDPTKGEIIEICIITTKNGKFDDEFYTKIRPENIERADPKSLLINGYDAEQWAGAPVWDDICAQIHKKLKWGLIVAHNVQFDVGYLNHHFKGRIPHRYKCSYLQLDTQMLCTEHLPIKKRSMAAVRTFFGWDGTHAHTARVDAYDCMRLFFKLHRATSVQRWWWRVRHRVQKCLE